MPKYKVSYETNTRPTGLPAGAVVEEIAKLPVHIESVGEGVSVVNREVDVQKSVFDSKAAFVRIAKEDGDLSSVSAHLTTDEAVEVADALYEAAGKRPAATGPSQDHRINDRVRLIDNGVSYVGSTPVGSVGTVTQTIDDDQEIRVMFDTGSDYYVKYYGLAAA